MQLNTHGPMVINREGKPMDLGVQAWAIGLNRQKDWGRGQSYE
jgi:hypothetical protein